MFADKVSIYVKAGDGGNGLVSFLHEKFREFGGPDGGDGGKGGNVVLAVDDNLNTLYYYKTHHKMIAQRGEGGKKLKCHGKNGQNLVVKVPRGTVIFDEKTGVQLGDLSDIDELIIAKGGSGGFGNAHFISSTRQSPKVSELGEPGEEKNIILELKLIADVGLVGLPNVGKSTLLSVITSAKPKIADYEFTTLIPNLGVIEEGKFGVEKGFIAADIPGLIEGASQGKGLGDEFLRHIERTRVLVHLLDASHHDLAQDYKTIRNELKYYTSTLSGESKIDLTDRPEIVVVSKIDIINPDDLKLKTAALKKVAKGKKIIEISAPAHKNITELLHEIEKTLVLNPKKKEEAQEPQRKVFTLEDVVGHDIYSVEKKGEKYIVTGKKIEKFAIRTDFSNPHAVLRLKDIMKKTGVEKELRRSGAQPGDKIEISGKTFEF